MSSPLVSLISAKPDDLSPEISKDPIVKRKSRSEKGERLYSDFKIAAVVLCGLNESNSEPRELVPIFQNVIRKTDKLVKYFKKRPNDEQSQALLSIFEDASKTYKSKLKAIKDLIEVPFRALSTHDAKGDEFIDFLNNKVAEQEGKTSGGILGHQT